MYIETPRMIIRDFTPEDAADLHEIFGDDETMENCELAYDFDKTEKFLISFCIERKGAVAAVHKESGKMMGYILFNEAYEGVYEMGWIYNRSFWRQGYAYESCRAVIDYAFGELNAVKNAILSGFSISCIALSKKRMPKTMIATESPKSAKSTFSVFVSCFTIILPLKFIKQL